MIKTPVIHQVNMLLGPMCKKTIRDATKDGDMGAETDDEVNCPDCLLAMKQDKDEEKEREYQDYLRIEQDWAKFVENPDTMFDLGMDSDGHVVMDEYHSANSRHRGHLRRLLNIHPEGITKRILEELIEYVMMLDEDHNHMDD